MDFRVVVCPKCNHKQIVSYITCGVPCHQCGTFLNAIDYHDEARREYAKGTAKFYTDADEYAKDMKRWDQQHLKVEFKVVSIADDVLLDMVNI